jgi:hypothetical protein
LTYNTYNDFCQCDSCHSNNISHRHYPQKDICRCHDDNNQQRQQCCRRSIDKLPPLRPLDNRLQQTQKVYIQKDDDHPSTACDDGKEIVITIKIKD